MALDMLGPLWKTLNDTQYVLVMTGCCLKLTKPVPTSNTTASTTASPFIDNLITHCGIRTHRLTENGTLLASKFLKSFRASLGTKYFTNAAYHPQTSAQAEGFNKTIITGLQQYVAKPHRDWDMHLQPLKCTYNTQVHRAAILPHFNLMLSRPLPGPRTFDCPTSLPADETRTASPLALNARLLHQVATIDQDADKRMKSLQQR